MIDRLEKILQGTLQTTDIDKRFFTHEIRELERFRALGIADKILPTDRGEAWNNTHAATLEDYQSWIRCHAIVYNGSSRSRCNPT
jgi:hypothetical protein